MSVVEKNQLVDEKIQAKVIPKQETPGSKGEDNSVSFLDVWFQVFVSCVSLTTCFQTGINLAFSGVMLPQLAEDPVIGEYFSDVEASWIASLAVISQPVGSLVGGPLVDRFGRRNMCIFQNIPIIIGWITAYYTSDTLWPLYIARLFCGFGAGLSVVGLVYTSEIAHISYRAILLSGNSVHIAAGILLTTIIGVNMDWHNCAMVFAILGFLSFIASFFLPESPVWMATYTDAQYDDIKLVVRKLNKKNNLFQEEWERIQETIATRRQQVESGEAKKSWCEQFQDSCYCFKERTSYLPFMILLGLFLLQQASGTYVVIFYTVNIFRSIGGDIGYGLDEYTATIAVGVIRFVLSVVASGISRVVGRRPIMLLSSAGLMFTSFAAAAFLYLNNIKTIDFRIESSNATNITLPEVGDRAVNEWWIMISVLLNVSFGSVGLMVIPWTLIGEILPFKIRALGTGLMIAYGTLLLFIIIKTFPFFVQLLSLYNVFIFYMAMSGVCYIFVYYFLPETHGKSFSEIEKYFVKKKVNANLI